VVADLNTVWSAPAEPPRRNGHGRAAGLVRGAAQPDGDWALVGELSDLVGDRLTQVIKTREEAGQQLSEAAKRQLGKKLIEEELRKMIRDRSELGQSIPAPGEEDWLRRSIYAVQFGLGRLEALVADPDIENIIINGHDRVQLRYADGRLVDGPEVADSEEELLALVNRIGTRLGSAERALTPANPKFRMSLPDGSRLSAVSFVTPRTQVAIRRHRTAAANLADMAEMGMISSSLRAFLGALVRCRKSTLVVGAPNAGKTSLLRAMLHECAPSERIAIIESENELNLHADGVRHPWILPLEARPGSTERHGAGEVTLSDLVKVALGQTASRLVVGEALGGELIQLLNALMTGGSGMGTMHAESARDAFTRMTVMCQPMPAEAAYRLAAVAVQYVVVVELVDETAIGGRMHRYVREVARVAGVGVGGLPDLDYVYQAGEDGRAVPLGKATDLLTLRRAGFDPAWLDPSNGGWKQPLDLVVRG